MALGESLCGRLPAELQKEGSLLSHLLDATLGSQGPHQESTAAASRGEPATAEVGAFGDRNPNTPFAYANNRLQARGGGGYRSGLLGGS